MARAKTAGRTQSVHVITGLKAFDSFLAERACEEILQAAIGSERGAAFRLMRGDECTWGQLVNEARSRSLFATRRAILVRNADALKGDDTEVPAYLADPNPDVTLVLVAPKVDKRRAAWKAVMDAATVVAAEPLKGRAVEAFVTQETRRRGLAFSADAVSELTDRFGQDLRRTIGEIDKIEAYALGRTQITADDVAAVLGRGIARPLYKLGDAIATRDEAGALKLVGELLDDREDATMLVATLHRSLRQVRGALALKQARAARPAMLSRLGIPPPMEFKLNGLLEAAGRWSDADLAVAFRALFEADRGIKGGADGSAALTAAVVSACGGTARRSGRPAR